MEGQMCSSTGEGEQRAEQRAGCRALGMKFSHLLPNWEGVRGTVPAGLMVSLPLSHCLPLPDLAVPGPGL